MFKKRFFNKVAQIKGILSLLYFVRVINLIMFYLD